MYVEVGMLLMLCLFGLCKVIPESDGAHDICTGLVNLPGWCWAEIQQFALVGSSSSLHSEACNALGASDGVIHSRISQEVDCFRASTNIRIDTQSIVLLLCCVRLPCMCCPSMAPHTCLGVHDVCMYA